MITNATILSLLTICKENKENIIHAYRKEVEDIAPDAIHWYSKKGSNGKAEYIWEDKELKQWLAVGNEGDISEIWEKLIKNDTIKVNISGVEVTFLMPEVELIQDNENYVKIKDVEVCGRNEYPLKYKSKSGLSGIDTSFLLGEKTNCSYISGYNNNKKIKPVYPYGLFGEESLYKDINNNVFAVYRKRGNYMTFRGDRKSVDENNDTTKMKGFSQSNIEYRKQYKVQIKDIEGEQILGESNIDEKTGKWNIDLSKGASKGQLLIVDKKNNDVVCGQKYYLLKNIDVNVGLVDTVLKDLFGRNISISKDKKSTLAKEQVQTVIWDGHAAPDDRQAQIELSDKLTGLLLSLGEKIKFIDPFFWGKVEMQGDIVKTNSQKIFLNALITAIAKGDIKEIEILGCWKRYKKVHKGEKENFINGYKSLNELINKTFDVTKGNKLEKLELVFSEELFHDRYWIGQDVIYSVTNSISGAFDSKELKFSKEDDLSKLKVRAKYDRRYSKAGEENLVKL